MNQRYKISKLGFVNFWYYDFEEFLLSDGKLLLRGSNGSGKSVTMQSFIPLLLDGNKSPYRLDPFGTNARTISGYLLDEDHTERTGYLYMEFKRKDSEHYLTLGMGIKAQQNMPPKSWYFILHDGRRINKDLLLYRDMGEKIPLTKKQLQNALGEANFFTDSQKAYMAEVNKYLFGFDDLDSYEELLNLLISIRSPKLSKDFKPTEIYKILTESLKVLSEDDLRPVSEALENMDTLKDRLEENEAALKATKLIHHHYESYNRHVLSEKAHHFIQGQKSLDDLTKNKTIMQKTGEEQEITLKNIIKDLNYLRSELQKAEATYENLQSGEGFKLKKEEQDLKDRLLERDEERLKKEDGLAWKKSSLLQLDQNLRDLSDQIDQTDEDLGLKLREIDELSKEISFESGRDLEKDDLSGVEILIKSYEKKVKEALQALISLENHKKRMDLEEQRTDGLKNQQEQKKKDLLGAEELFSTEKENYKVVMTLLSEKNTEWVLLPEERTLLFSELEKVDKAIDLTKIQESLSSGYSHLAHGINGMISTLHRNIQELHGEKAALEEKILDLRNQKEVEPDRSEGVQRNRLRLQELNIPFVPLYKALDFDKDVSNPTRDAIESALVGMGLIDALVIEEKHRDLALDFPSGMEDRYLFAKPNIMSFNLSSWLNVDGSLENPNLGKSMDEILQSIFIDTTQDIFINERAHYNLGILRGRGNAERKHILIGEAARKRRKEALIGTLQEDMAALNFKILDLENKKSIQDYRMATLKEEYQTRPHLEHIESGLQLIQDIILDLEKLEDHIKKAEDQGFLLNQQFKEMNIEVFHLIKEIQLPHTSQAYLSALEDIDELKDILRDSIVLYHAHVTQTEQKRTLDERISSLVDEVEDFSGDLHKIQTNLNTLKIQLHSIKEALSKTNIEEIEEELQRCLAIKKSYPEKITAHSTEMGGLRQRISSLNQEIIAMETTIVLQKNTLTILGDIFQEEYHLGYVLEEKESSLLKLAKKIRETFPQEKTISRDVLTKRLIDSFNQNSAALREYSLNLQNILPDANQDPLPGMTRERWDIQCRIQGKPTGFLQLMETIKATVEEQKLLISTEERHIFEEILMNTVSDKIQAKIFQSRDWIEKINTIMGDMNTSSTLKLSLTWTPNKAEEEGQLNVTDIFDILVKKGRNTEESLHKLANHFILKVKDTLRRYEGSGEMRNYHSIIKEVLDYRQWYQFKLHFTMENERKKELTNNEFFKFSGGEKAMSMYIPLFSALYARYLKAGKHCPRIITMDEAFAGVDDENIRDMFKLLKKLDMDYILNSQILWGTYDTVDNLSINELIRENNEKMVTVIRYHWNGKEKRLVDE